MSITNPLHEVQKKVGLHPLPKLKSILSWPCSTLLLAPVLVYWHWRHLPIAQARNHGQHWICQSRACHPSSPSSDDLHTSSTLQWLVVQSLLAPLPHHSLERHNSEAIHWLIALSAWRCRLF